MALPKPRGKQCEVLALKPTGQHVVLGTAGSGKTTLAILWAAYLADPTTDHFGKTLLVTFNNSLVTFLKSYGMDELKHVTVETIHKFANGYLASRDLGRPVCKGWNPVNLTEQALRKKFPDAAGKLGLSTETLARMINNEYQIACYNGVRIGEQYLNANLPGADSSVTQYLDKVSINCVFEEYLARRDAEQQHYDYADMLVAAHEAMIADGSHRRYKHIVIDEGQDFAPIMLRTLAAAVAKDGCITFFGDVTQQIYGRRISWRNAGFDKAKPPIKFEENLRNTMEIAQLGLAISRMPYYAGVADMVAPKGNPDEGLPVTLVQAASEAGEIRLVIEQAKRYGKTRSLAILCPTNAHVDTIGASLGSTEATRIDRDLPEWTTNPGIRYGTYHCAKGLEFDTVILPFCNDSNLPIPKVVELHGRKVAETDCGSLLYVGVTRARSILIITYCGTVTPLLPPDPALYSRQ